MRHRFAIVLILSIFPCSAVLPLAAQSPTATVNGQVRDATGAVVQAADVQLVNDRTNVRFAVKTNGEGIYSLTNLPPGTYHIQVSKAGFKTLVKPDIVLNVLDARAINFDLPVGATSQTVTVEGGAPMVDTESSAVSTVVDRQFAENLPMNGRSFQTLIELTPGVVLTANNGIDTGQFSINGQRASSNYWMVDGVSANIGIAAGQTPGNGLGGTLGSSSVLGGTNSLVSVDALQEFRLQTSTFAPEFGRTPGGQISIVTRSGTNQFHGTVFDYLRNDVLDANNWFNGVNIFNPTPLPKAEERQNDFGGTLGGPIVKDRTFFFFSYEGLRLRLPQTALTNVPDASFTPGGTTNSRQSAMPALQPYLNAFPLPNRNSPEILCDPATGPTCPSSGVSGSAAFNASYSNPATLNAYSLRIDHRLNDKLSLFVRYNYSPSKISVRGGAAALSTVSAQSITTQTGTASATWLASPTVANDFRFNYSDTDASSYSYLDGFGGAVPVTALPFPNSFTTQNAVLGFSIYSLGITSNGISSGASAHNLQRQINVVDNVSWQKGAHALKFGVDFRRLSPQFDPVNYQQLNQFFTVPDAGQGSAAQSIVISGRSATFLFRNLGIFAQDTWHAFSRLTLTYGLRWDVDFVPSSLNGPDFNAVTGFDLSNLSNLALAPAGTPPYSTNYGNVAPRVGLAYQISQNPNRQTVLRGGFGVFYDLASSEAGNTLDLNFYPFGASTVVTASFPLSTNNAMPPPLLAPGPTNPGFLFGAFDPHLKTPRTLQWNVALEQSLGPQQTITASYIGAAGRRLLQTAVIYTPNLNLFGAQLVTNAGTSDYDALQLQFQRRLSRGLQALASYSWSHSIDTASAGSVGNNSNALIALNSNVNRGPSDFDRRNALSAALTYDVPFPEWNAFANALLRGWSTENIVQAQSAAPVDVYYSSLYALSTGFATNSRPDVVAGQPFYLYGSQYPGGKALNAAAFTSPPIDPITLLPSSQGNLPRNGLRGFGLVQWDFAVHRDFPIHESVKLQFRAEMFNLLNHPNFGPPIGDLQVPGAVNPQFGLSQHMLGQSLSGGFIGAGAFDPLYQVGGPRSIQVALKVFF